MVVLYFLLFFIIGEDETLGCIPIASPPLPSLSVPVEPTSDLQVLPKPFITSPTPQSTSVRHKRVISIDSPSRKSVEPPRKKLDEKHTPKIKKITAKVTIKFKSNGISSYMCPLK